MITKRGFSNPCTTVSMPVFIKNKTSNPQISCLALILNKVGKSVWLTFNQSKLTQNR